jgi:hypothetical protein
MAGCLRDGCVLDRLPQQARLAFIHADLASAYALKGETELAVAELREAQRVRRDGRFEDCSPEEDGILEVPVMRGRFETVCFVGLRKAGMREE